MRSARSPGAAFGVFSQTSMWWFEASHAGRLRRAKPSSPAQHHVEKLYLQTELFSTLVAHVGSQTRCHVAGLRSAGSPLCLTRCHRSPVSFSCHFFLARLINAPPSVPVTDTGAGRTAAWALSVLTTPFLQLVAILARRRDRPSRSRRRAHPAAAPRAGPAARSDRRRGPPSADPSSGAGHRSAQCAAAVASLVI